MAATAGARAQGHSGTRALRLLPPPIRLTTGQPALLSPLPGDSV